MKKILAKIWEGILILWEDFLIGLKMVFYILLIIFFIFGIIALFSGAPGLGIFLIVLNALLFLLLRKLNKASDKKFEKEFEEMVRKNREE